MYSNGHACAVVNYVPCLGQELDNDPQPIFDDMTGLNTQLAALEKVRQEIRRLQEDASRHLAVLQDDLTCQIRSRLQLLTRRTGVGNLEG